MLKVSRFEGNPVLSPTPENHWEKEACFNGCPVVDDGGICHFLYRAMSSFQEINGKSIELSTIGYAKSFDRVSFQDRRQFIFPQKPYEKYGCEDPRVTRLNGKYYIFYTALSNYPFTPEGIKIAVATTKDFQKVEDRHLVTHFNSKAMALFPEKIGGKLAAILTADTDKPPAKIALAYFENESQIWDRNYWEKWYSNLNNHTINFLHEFSDHIEIGAVPLKTKKGWLLLYCYISNYFFGSKLFQIRAALLDLQNPLKILGTTKFPLLIPERDYEIYGKINNVIFPSGALIFHGELGIYYGAADTSCCLATCNLNKLLAYITRNH